MNWSTFVEDYNELTALSFDHLLRRQNNTRDFNREIHFDRIVSLLGN